MGLTEAIRAVLTCVALLSTTSVSGSARSTEVKSLPDDPSVAASPPAAQSCS